MRRPLAVTGILFLSSTAALAEYSATIDLGLRLSRDEDRSARFTEYRDFSDGLLSGAELHYSNGAYHMEGLMRNAGQDDQSYFLNGGQYHSYRYKLWFDFLPHNYSFGTISPYTGLGTDALTYTAANRGSMPATTNDFLNTELTNTGAWNPFKYKMQRKDLGAELDLALAQPFFATLSASRVSASGGRPTATASGVYASYVGASSGFNLFEFPEEINQSTTDVTLEAGYKTQQLYVSLTGSLNKFDHEHDYMSFRNPMISTQEVNEKYSLSPDSLSKAIALQATVFQLPIDSTLQVRGSIDHVTNSVPLLTQILSMNNLALSGTPASLKVAAGTTYFQKDLSVTDEAGNAITSFEGEFDYRDAAVVWSAHPIQGLDAEVFYRYLNKKNDSTELTYTSTVTNATEAGYAAATPTRGASNHRLGYRKNNAGVNLGYKLPARTRIRAGYEHLATARVDRADTPGTRDSSVFVEAQNSYLKFLSGRLRYGYLRRTSDFARGDDANPAVRLNRLFDVTDKRENSVRASMTVTPIDEIDVTAGYSFRKNVYDQTFFGLTDDKSNEWNFDVGYNFEGFHVGLFADVEDVSRHGYHRVYTSNGDPSAAPSGTEFNWEDTWKDKQYRYGINAAVPVGERLVLDASWAQERANGLVDIEAQAGVPAANQPVDITNFGDYFKRSFHARARYKVTDRLGATIGALWEKLESDDFQFVDYRYLSQASRYLLSGAYADNAYSATTGYLLVSYTF